MKPENRQIINDFLREAKTGATYLLLAALLLITVSMFGFAVLFSDAEVTSFINLLWGK